MRQSPSVICRLMDLAVVMHQRIPGAVSITGNDTTGTIQSPVIDNKDGRIESINAAITTTASSGTSPTANLILKGSLDGTNFYTIQSADAIPVAVQSGALSTSAATTIGFDSAQELRTGNFPPYLRVDLVQGGTTPGITGIESLFIVRKHVQK